MDCSTFYKDANFPHTRCYRKKTQLINGARLCTVDGRWKSFQALKGWKNAAQGKHGPRNRDARRRREKVVCERWEDRKVKKKKKKRWPGKGRLRGGWRRPEGAW